MKLSREKLASAILDYFCTNYNLSYFKLAEKTGIDQKTLKKWHINTGATMRSSGFSRLIQALEKDITENFDGFSNFMVNSLENSGIEKRKINSFFTPHKEISVIMNELLELDITSGGYLQDYLGTENIIKNLKFLCSQYREFFQISDQIIGEGDATMAYAPLAYTTKHLDTGKHLAKELNYVILKFPKSYHVCILLTNYQFDFSNRENYNYFLYMIEKLKVQNNFQMLIFVSDIDKKNIPLRIQSSLMKSHNLFFEFVKKTYLQKISIHGFELQNEESENIQKSIDQFRYAQLIFDRFMSYLAVINNEIIFQPHLDKLHKELDRSDKKDAEIYLNSILTSYSMRNNIRNFTEFSNQLLLKGICQYTYLDRHSIYYERTLLEKILDDYNVKRVELAIEICSPKALITSSIIQRCDKLLLFSASHNAYSLMNKLETKTGNKFLPANVSLRLSHLNPEYMMHQYSDELNGKVDLLVIGYGTGSQIEDLIRFLRYAYNWLSEDGILFLSTYNRDAINLNQKLFRDQRFERIPFNQTDYWMQTLDEQTILLKKSKTYTPEWLKSVVGRLLNTSNISRYTYPYLSALINPDEYSREVLDEIREADKSFAQKGKHGQLINIVAQKNISSNSSSMQIRTFLKNHDIHCQFYSHTLAPDSLSLKRSLNAENISLQNSIILKTVILQAKDNKTADLDTWLYVILPYDINVTYDNSKYSLVSESLFLKYFNQGSISPLAVITEINNGNIPSSRVILMNREKISCKSVFMGGGSNTESVRMKTKDFFKIITAFNISSQNNID